MDTANLQAFIKVAETRSFSLAAEQLFLTQPAISKRIKQLEEQLGTHLIDRIGKQLNLTRTGELLLPKARQVMLDLQSIRQQIADMEGNPMGSLSMATSHHIGLHRLPPVLRAYSAEYPEVDLDLHFMDSEQACTLIEHNQMDLAVVTLPFVTSSVLDYQIVWQDELKIVCSNTHPLTQIEKPMLEMLPLHTAILPSHGTFTREAIESALAPYKDELKISLETNYLETIKMMVSVGLGWSILPMSMVDHSLIALDIAEFSCSRQLGIVINPRRSHSRAVDAMLQTIQQFAGG
jgi:DNA-binding transcriptional LysR family regulator